MEDIDRIRQRQENRYRNGQPLNVYVQEIQRGWMPTWTVGFSERMSERLPRNHTTAANTASYFRNNFFETGWFVGQA